MRTYTAPDRATSLRTFAVAVIGSVLPASAALAHPGDHGSEQFLSGLFHLVSEPDHLAAIGVAVAAGILVARLARKRMGRSQQD